MNPDQPPTPMKNETPITKLPDDSGCFTTTILSRDEAMALPLKDRPLNYRISSEIYHAVFEAVGAASLCWNPKPGDEVFDASAASKIATDLCFKIAKDIEKTFPDQPPAPTPNVSETPRTDGKVLTWNLSERELRERQPNQLGYNGTSINGKVVLADFARRLERELASMMVEREEWKRLYYCSIKKHDDVESERDLAEAQLAAVTKERDILHDWKESALSILNEINFQEIGKALGLGLGLSVPKNIQPGIRALQEKLAMATIERDEAKERADNMESERDHAEANMDAALARAEKAEEDTRRLDWLEQQFGLAIWRGVMIDDNKPVFDIHEPREEGWDDALGEELGSGRTLRAAIDAALTHTKEPAP